MVNGRPYICDMITDSMVLCFYIEAEKILALLSSDPAIEDFFWKVCRLVKKLIFFNLGIKVYRHAHEKGDNV